MKMILKIITKSLCKPYVYKNVPLRYSALFVNGPKATENYVFLLPHLDLPERLNDKDKLIDMLSKRQFKFDLDKMENLWQVYEELRNHKIAHQNQKNKLFNELSELLKTTKEGNKVEQLKIQINLLKENLKNLKEPFWSAEEAAVTEALKIPNVIHTLTPAKNNKIIFEYKRPPTNNKNHLMVGEKQNLLKFMKNNNYYLMGDAAVFELGANFFCSASLKRNNFVQFSCPDFVKSLIVEGCGLDHTDPKSTFILHHNENSEVHQDHRLHLTGAGSICSFFAYHAKTVINRNILPLKYFCMGRLYTPATGPEPSLFNVSQSSVVQMFIATKDESNLDEQLQGNIELIKTLYSSFNCHFRLSYLSADKLYNWESLRVAIEMYSTSLNKYVEVGHLSASNDFISKRLMFTYMDDKQSKFPHILSGTVLNIPKFIACALEQDEDFVVPDCFKVDLWKHNTHTEAM